MTVPVTTGGKNRTILENTGAISSPMAAEAMTAPKTAGRPPPPVTMATMVATLAKETPWTRGSWEPKNGTPRVWSSVARPPMKRAAAIRTPMSAGARPAAWPTIRGTAMMPPYMVRTCWKP